MMLVILCSCTAFAVVRHAPPCMVLPEAGSSCPPAILTRLSIANQRAVIAFISDDKGFNCAKQVLALAERSDGFLARSCALFAVRPPTGVRDEIVERYRGAGIMFVVDEDNALRAAAGLDASGKSRATLVVEADGSVCGTVSNAVESTAHAAYALRLLREADERRVAQEAASQPSLDELRELVVAAAAPSDEEAQAAEQLEERRAAAALRAQALRAEANRNVLFSFGRKTLAEEGERLAKAAGEALERAATNEASGRQERARAEAAGDAATAEVCKAEVLAAATLALRAREDEIAALEIVYEAAEQRQTAARLQRAQDEINAAETARLAYGFRRDATQAMVGLQAADERQKMRQELDDWVRKQAADTRLADGYRAAVEAAWAKSESVSEDTAPLEVSSEAQRWADQLSLVDPAEMPQVRAQMASFASVTEAVSYRTASDAVEKAETAEARALAATAALEATKQAEAEAGAELDELDVRMGKKAKVVEARAVRDAPNGEADTMRAALELAMLRTSTEPEAEEPQRDEADDDQKIRQLEATIAELKAQQQQNQQESEES